MKVWPSSLAGRLFCAFMLAVAMLIALSFVVEWLDSGPKPTKRAGGFGPLTAHAGGRDQPVGADRADRSAGPTDVPVGQPVVTGKPVAPPTRPSLASPASFEVARRLRPVHGTILCAHREASLSPDIAPVVEILANGELILRRPAPLASGPVPVAATSGAGHGAGIVLPSHDLEKLTPAARGALIALLRRWLPERPIPPQKLQSSDVRMVPVALRRLLSWIP